jgi:hypothetical protein
MTTPSRAEKMQAIYDQVPEMADCKGNCWISCGPASMTPWERKRLADAGHRVTPDEVARKAPYDFWCEALGPDGRCMAYDIRPLICRLWGAAEWLPCPWGCVPEGGFLSVAESVRLLYESLQIGGGGYPIPDEAFEKLSDPEHVAGIAAELAGRDCSDVARFRIYGNVLPAAITCRPGLRAEAQNTPPRPAEPGGAERLRIVPFSVNDPSRENRSAIEDPERRRSRRRSRGKRRRLPVQYGRARCKPACGQPFRERACGSRHRKARACAVVSVREFRGAGNRALPGDDLAGRGCSRPEYRGLLPADRRGQVLPAWRVLPGRRPRDNRHRR